MKVARYEWWRGINGEFFWHLKGRNGEIVGEGEGYKTRAGVLRGIETHRRIAHTALVRERSGG